MIPLSWLLILSAALWIVRNGWLNVPGIPGRSLPELSST